MAYLGERGVEVTILAQGHDAFLRSVEGFKATIEKSDRRPDA